MSKTNLVISPISFSDAKDFVEKNHRHHSPPVGHKFSVGLKSFDILCGIVIVGRPVSRHLDDGFTLEVTRLCTDGTANACSKLLSCARHVSKNLGYRYLITYILETESGISLRAAGFRFSSVSKGGSWSRKSRLRSSSSPKCKKHKYSLKL